MRRCSSGQCRMFCMWKASRSTCLLKACGRCDPFTRTRWDENNSATMSMSCKCSTIINLFHDFRFCHQVGLVLDAGMEEDLRVRHLQVADATRASLGLPVVEYIVTDTPLQVEKWIEPESGQSTGRIRQPGSLLRAVEKLVNSSGIDAVAVVGRFPDDDAEEFVDYRQGKGIDILAGVEAVISHLVVEKFCLPCAHAPALLPLPLDSSLCPKSAAEEIGFTFLPCVLAGLSKAPQYLVTTAGSVGTDCLVASDVDSLVLPIDACGGIGSLAFANSDRKKRPLIIAVKENETVLDDTPDKIGIDALVVSNYWEALGVIAAHKAGIDPLSMRKDATKRIRQFSSSMLTSNRQRVEVEQMVSVI
ncbi:uncharacterized protein LOC116255616 isoform X2 [Nymphaea colorata]|uniref:uncharacterized protein LOC116255616 isoform X2 n=1 Tax=Nymphaea colorata TaxID=210225 RepID=UPI00129E8412|nr:uncharacterized protein LOC116255616 isoform X2 [Nymphaea colorata]